MFYSFFPLVQLLPDTNFDNAKNWAAGRMPLESADSAWTPPARVLLTKADSETSRAVDAAVPSGTYMFGEMLFGDATTLTMVGELEKKRKEEEKKKKKEEKEEDKRKED